jgi:hypothetical protein
MLVVKHKEVSPAVPVKDDTYRITLSSIKQFENTYGKRIGFEFTITSGPYEGEMVLRSTAPQLTRQSNWPKSSRASLGTT